MARVLFENVGKVYDNGTRALTALTLEIEDGEFMVLVGPSGCGKTTALRMVAGLETITEGEVRIGGPASSTTLPPKERDVAMVFQNYALYPHMTVSENIGFALQDAEAVSSARSRTRRSTRPRASLEAGADYLDRKPGAAFRRAATARRDGARDRSRSAACS